MFRTTVFGTLAALMLGLSGCGASPRTPDRMTVADFAVWLQGQTGLSDIALTEQSDGRFEGIAKKNDRPYRITAVRKQGEATWEAKAEGPGNSDTIGGGKSW